MNQIFMKELQPELSIARDGDNIIVKLQAARTRAACFVILNSKNLTNFSLTSDRIYEFYCLIHQNTK